MTTLRNRNKLDTHGILSILNREGFAAARWDTLGVMLGVPSHILENIRLERAGQANMQLVAVIDYWLNNLKANWEVLADALEQSNHRRIADIIREAENIQRSRSDNSSSSGTESDRNVSRDRGGGSPVNSGGSSVSSGGFQMNGVVYAIIGVAIITMVVGGSLLLRGGGGGVSPKKDPHVPREIDPNVPDKDFPSTPIQRELDLETELSEVADWNSLCSYLGVSRSVIDDLDNSGESATLKKRKCLNKYYDNGEADWAKVVTVVANPPINKKKKACEIAAKYIEGIDKKTCLEKFKN